MKPFEPRELVARIQSVLRRGPAEEAGDGLWDFENLAIDEQRRVVRCKEEELEFSDSEFEVLLYLVQNHGRVLSRDQILGQLRGSDWAAFDRSVDVLISRIRQKLGDNPKNPEYIRTVWNRGYKFVARPR